MQKAIVVRTAIGEELGQSWSIEVDPIGRSMESPLRSLLADGWRVIHTCAMPSEIDSCCLVVLEKNDAVDTSIDDQPLSQLNHSSEWLRLQTPRTNSRRNWDGETISLAPFGIATPTVPEQPSRAA
ncbi:MAG: hypothetical protein U1D30_14195 [Planctomycetota bacterium]